MRRGEGDQAVLENSARGRIQGGGPQEVFLEEVACVSDLPNRLISSCAALVVACDSTEEKCFRQCDLDTGARALLSHRTTSNSTLIQEFSDLAQMT